MNVPVEMRARVENEVKRYVNLAIKKTGRHYNVPLVHFDLRGRAAGMAYGTYKVSFNPILLMENPDEYFGETIAHEVAHCIDTANGDNQSVGIRMDRYGQIHRAKRKIHGPSWQHIMRNIFGVEPERTHQMDTTNAQVRVKTKYEYQCTSCQMSMFVSSVRHNKQHRHAIAHPGASFYTCRRCGRERGKLKFIANRGQVSFEQAREAAKQKAPAKVTADHIPPQAQPPTRVESSPSLVDRARKIYKLYSGIGRQTTIAKMVEIGIKQTTASTYYQNFKSGK